MMMAIVLARMKVVKIKKKKKFINVVLGWTAGFRSCCLKVILQALNPSFPQFNSTEA